MKQCDLDQVSEIEKQNFSMPWTREDYENCIRKQDFIVLTAAQEGGAICGSGNRETANGGEGPGQGNSGSYRDPEKTAKSSSVKTDDRGVRERVFGYIAAMISLDEADICSVSVDKSCEGKGFGTSLVKEMLRELAGRKVRNVFLEVRESNAGAIHLYEKCGFEKIAVRKNYYTKPEENALVMKMCLEQDEGR